MLKSDNDQTLLFKGICILEDIWAENVNAKVINLWDFQVNWTKPLEEWDHGFFNFSKRSGYVSHNSVENCGND